MKAQIQVIAEPRVNSAQSLESLIQSRSKLKALIDEAKADIEVIDEQLKQEVAKSAEKKLTVAGTSISLFSRLNFTQVDLKIAKKYYAVKEVVDTDVLRPLYAKLGDKVFKGVTHSEYLVVREVK